MRHTARPAGLPAGTRGLVGRGRGARPAAGRRRPAAPQAVPVEFRVAVYLADIEGFAYKEIAQITNSPIGTVMSRLHRGRNKLRELPEDHARQHGLLTAGRPDPGAPPRVTLT